MSNDITITLPDKSTMTAAKGDTVFSVIGKIGKGLQKSALAAEINGEKVDLASTLQADAALNVLTFDSPAGKDVFWHSASHLMAQAVKRLYPDTKLTIGPAIEQGFYYDFFY